jgi:hypothetical protein
MQDAEAVTMASVVVTKDGRADLEETRKWKERIEAWRMRGIKGCPDEIRDKLGARRLL